MTQREQEKIASTAAEIAFARVFGDGEDWSLGMEDYRPTKDGALITNWTAAKGKRVARCFLTVCYDGGIPFLPVAYVMP